MSESKTKTDNNKSRLGNCEVCDKNEARYACPKCEVKTCALNCVQIHKRELNCDGIRDRTKYMALSEMTEREFLSDYCFLEECTRYAENRKKDHCKRYTHQQRQLPVPIYRMRQEALKRDIKLQFLLPNFTRHKENSTYLNWKLHRFFWHIEWLFIQPDNDSTRFVDSRCDEDQRLCDLLQKYLNLEQETAREQRKLLQHHQTAGIGQLTFWLRAEGVKRSGKRCYPLAAHKTLRDNLAGKTIVEFPTIYISYEQRPPTGYDIIDSDEETDVTDIATESFLNNKRNQETIKLEKGQQPTAKKSKSTAIKSEELNESHNIYGLTGEDEEEEDDDDENNDEDNNEENDESEASSDELFNEFEEPLTTY